MSVEYTSMMEVILDNASEDHEELPVEDDLVRISDFLIKLFTKVFFQPPLPLFELPSSGEESGGSSELGERTTGAQADKI